MHIRPEAYVYSTRMKLRVRYAPSPTGSPHVGNLRTALFDWLIARRTGGTFIARLEDTDRDPARYKPQFIGEIAESLRYLGIEPDEWWESPGEFGAYLQSDRLDRYREVAEQLIASGKAYRCYCTREELQAIREEQIAKGLPTSYDRRHRHLTTEERENFEAEGRSFVVRLAIPLEGCTEYDDLVYGHISVENRVVEDVVLLKSTGWPTYHLAAMVDDHDMQITHVIRGEDWMPSTPQHVQLHRSMGWTPPVWVHVPLILGTDRKKLSKRHGSTQFLDFIREGYLPEAMFNFLALLGWSPGEGDREIMSAEEISSAFSLEAISRNPAVLDYDKLRWMNGEYIRKCEPDRLVQLCVPYLARAGFVSESVSEDEAAYVAKVVPLIAERMKCLSEAPAQADFFFRAPQAPDDKGRKKWFSSGRATLLLESARGAIMRSSDSLTIEAAEQAIDEAAKAAGVERGPVIHTLRTALTGRTVGPGLFELMAVLGRDEVLSRIATALTWVQPEPEPSETV